MWELFHQGIIAKQAGTASHQRILSKKSLRNIIFHF